MKKITLLWLVLVFSVSLAHAQAIRNEGTSYFGAFYSYLPYTGVDNNTGIMYKNFFNDDVGFRLTYQIGHSTAKGPDPAYLSEDGESSERGYDIKDYSHQIKRIAGGNISLNFGIEKDMRLSKRFYGVYGLDLGVGYHNKREKGQREESIYDNYRDEYVACTVDYDYKSCRYATVNAIPFVGLYFSPCDNIDLGIDAGNQLILRSYLNNSSSVDGDIKESMQYNQIASNISLGSFTYLSVKLGYYF